MPLISSSLPLQGMRGRGMRARARFGEFPITHTADFDGMAIQAPPMRARPDFFGPAAVAHGRAWAMARPASPIGLINAHGSAAMPNGAIPGIDAPYAHWAIPRPLASGGFFPRRGPPPIPARPAPPSGWALAGSAQGGFGSGIARPMDAPWGWPMPHGGAGSNARSLGWGFRR